MIISRWILPRMRNFLDKFAEKIKIHMSYSVLVFRKSWENVEKYGTVVQSTEDNITRLMIHKATNTYSEYVILIDFPQQQLLPEIASALRYTYSTGAFRTVNCFSTFPTDYTLISQALHQNSKYSFNTDVMQQDADFITANFHYMFRASCAHHQEYKILTRQPPIQVRGLSIIYLPE